MCNGVKTRRALPAYYRQRVRCQGEAERKAKTSVGRIFSIIRHYIQATAERNDSERAKTKLWNVDAFKVAYKTRHKV